jgi:RHS repeat-associated protein
MPQQVTEYTLGLRQISQTTTLYSNGHPGAPTTLYFGHDGHGSVRVLMNAPGAIATIGGVRQIFNYDAYGNPVGFNVLKAATTLLYSGQQTEVRTGLEYLRARYYNPQSGTFTSLDPFSGDPTSPSSYNKYLYAQGDPVNAFDPSGQEGLGDMLATMSIIGGAAALGIGAIQSVRTSINFALANFTWLHTVGLGSYTLGDFLEIADAGLAGLQQGLANVLNSLSDAAIGLLNLGILLTPTGMALTLMGKSPFIPAPEEEKGTGAYIDEG